MFLGLSREWQGGSYELGKCELRKRNVDDDAGQGVGDPDYVDVFHGHDRNVTVLAGDLEHFLTPLRVTAVILGGRNTGSWLGLKLAFVAFVATPL